jgi:hypothetical protein
MSNNQFIAIVGAIILLSIGAMAFQKMARCQESGGTACCFGRLACHAGNSSPDGPAQK